jgi:predicted lipoprotein with Yx(FWY)xxD motif
VLSTGVAGAASVTVLRAASFKGYTNALVSGSDKTLYALSAEKGGKLHCKGSCLTLWLPLKVKDSVRAVSVGVGTFGKIGFIARGKTMKQVTFNSYPVYFYSGDDNKAMQANGEDIQADGGTWYMVSAASKKMSSTLLTSTHITTTTGGNGY